MRVVFVFGVDVVGVCRVSSCICAIVSDIVTGCNAVIDVGDAGVVVVVVVVVVVDVVVVLVLHTLVVFVNTRR